MKKDSKFYPIVLFLFLVAGSSVANGDEYPKYMGVDCSPGGYGQYGLTGIPEVDQYCTHIVCEEPGYCVPYHYPVYDIPALDYRGVRIVSDGTSGLLLRADGGAISWGDHSGQLENRIDIRNQLKTGVQDVYSSENAFAVVKSDGSLITWGQGEEYGDVDSTFLISNIATELASGIDRIFSHQAGFVALTKDGSVVSWGDGSDAKKKRSQGYKVPGLQASEVMDVRMTIGGEKNTISGTERGARAFAVLKKDGSVITWGDENSGGKIGASGLKNVVKISATKSAFAALRDNGSVAVWGNPYQGGSPLILDPYNPAVKPQTVQRHLRGGVKEIYANDTAFAAIKNDGTVVTWGTSFQGGDSSSVSSLLVNVVEVIPSYNGFTALTGDDTTVSWGEWLEPPYDPAPIHSDVKKVLGNRVGAYAALKNDGSVVSWGNWVDSFDASLVQSDVVDIYADYDSFAAIKEDGSVVSWGDRYNENGIYERLSDNGHFSAKGKTDPKRITAIISNSNSSGFFAIKNDGSFISWGFTAYLDHTYSDMDDPLWSNIFPNHYAWYFNLEPMKRESLTEIRHLHFAQPPVLTHQGVIVVGDFGSWAEFDAPPSVDDYGVSIIWHFSLEGYHSDGITPKKGVCTLWSSYPYSATHRRVVSNYTAAPGDICRVKAVGKTDVPYYSDYTGVATVDLVVAAERPEQE